MNVISLDELMRLTMTTESKFVRYSDHLAAIEQTRKEEREACALISQNCQYKLPFNWPDSNLWNHEVHTPKHAALAIAAAIRARKP